MKEVRGPLWCVAYIAIFDASKKEQKHSFRPNFAM